MADRREAVPLVHPPGHVVLLVVPGAARQGEGPSRGSNQPEQTAGRALSLIKDRFAARNSGHFPDVSQMNKQPGLYFDIPVRRHR